MQIERHGGGCGGEARFSITEVRIKLTDDPRNKLKAYASVTIDDAFVVRDLKVIDGAKGPFVAMPSRKLADHCQRCHHKNHLRASYCNQCGNKLDAERAPRDARGRARLHADLAHPINSATRIEMHKAVVRAYIDEIDAAKVAGANYQPKDFDDLDELNDVLDAEYVDELERRQEEREKRRREHLANGPTANVLPNTLPNMLPNVLPGAHTGIAATGGGQIVSGAG